MPAAFRSPLRQFGIAVEPTDQLEGFESFARRMAPIDAQIFAHAGDVARIGGLLHMGVFNNRYREIHMQDGTMVGLQISFDCQITPSVKALTRADAVRIEGTYYRFMRRIPDRGDETGLVIIELGTTQ